MKPPFSYIRVYEVGHSLYACCKLTMNSPQAGYELTAKQYHLSSVYAIVKKLLGKFAA